METDENVLFQHYKKLWNTRNISEPKLEWNLENRKDILIT
jgi:hypothetical protein